MKREDLKDLGLTDERDGLKSQLGEWDKQLDSLQKSSRDVDDLNEQIKQLQSDNKKDNEEWQNKLATQTKNFKIETALREAELETLVEVMSAKAKEDRPVSPREALRRLRGEVIFYKSLFYNLICYIILVNKEGGLCELERKDRFYLR